MTFVSLHSECYPDPIRAAFVCTLCEVAPIIDQSHHAFQAHSFWRVALARRHHEILLVKIRSESAPAAILLCFSTSKKYPSMIAPIPIHMHHSRWFPATASRHLQRHLKLVLAPQILMLIVRRRTSSE